MDFRSPGKENKGRITDAKKIYIYIHRRKVKKITKKTKTKTKNIHKSAYVSTYKILHQGNGKPRQSQVDKGGQQLGLNNTAFSCTAETRAHSRNSGRLHTVPRG